MQSNAVRHQPGYLVAHNLVNKLSAIIGHCDLLSQNAAQGTECAQRLGMIHDLAKSAAKELTDHQKQIAQDEMVSAEKSVLV
jgi:light-regulated signal transduction histidine kinase (bacteriophytochrome)